MLTAQYADEIHTGSTKPDLVIVLSAASGDFDATQASAIRIIGTRNQVIVIDRMPSSVTFENGVTILVMEWLLADTATVGLIQFEVQIEWPGGGKQTVDVEKKGVYVLPSADYSP